MEQFGAKQKVFKLPELVETLVSLLDPLSALRLIRSRVVDKETLKKSLSSEAWNKLIRRSWRWGTQLQEEEVKNMVNILKLVEVDKPRTFLIPLLDYICKSSFVHEWDKFNNEIHLICPYHPAAPLVVSHGDFLLLELVEAAFGTAEQSIVQVRSEDGMGWDELLSAISSRMSRQKEAVTSVVLDDIRLKDQSDIDAFLVLLQAQEISIRGNLVLVNSINQDGLKVVARGLKDKGRTNMKLGTFGISMKDVTPGMKDTIKDIWEAVDGGIWVCCNMFGVVEKSSYDWEGGWTRLQEISNEIEAEQAKEDEDANTSDDDTSDEESDSEEADEVV